MIRRVLLFPRDGEGARSATVHAARALAGWGIDVSVPEQWPGAGKTPGCRAIDVSREAGDIDLAIALGGDGTLLRVAHYVGDAGVPVMGINLGNLGFLTAFPAKDLDMALEKVRDGGLVWEPRLRMRVDVVRDEGAWSETGCNDAYIKHGTQPRMLQLATSVGGVPMANYRADGLIVCTPMGSTAYNLAPGGPIVDHGTDTFTITPICPHSLTHRPVVTGAARGIRIIYKGPGDAGPATLSVDGVWNRELKLGDEISIRRADAPLKLVPAPATVFDVLAHKMGWTLG
ncbi:MAG: NAD(+)/NADH kinase [Nannocystaceae bacterium]|nr:NAD(+)/NADH kinase [Nannocystaceae bacterium]